MTGAHKGKTTQGKSRESEAKTTLIKCSLSQVIAYCCLPCSRISAAYAGPEPSFYILKLCVCAHRCICVCVCEYVCVYCIHMCICVHASVYVCTCVCMRVCAYTHTLEHFPSAFLCAEHTSYLLRAATVTFQTQFRCHPLRRPPCPLHTVSPLSCASKLFSLSACCGLLHKD